MRFNRRTGTIPAETVNLAGGEAFVVSPKLEFASILLTSFVKDQYYRSHKDTTARLVKLMDAVEDKKFLAKSAIYARTKYGMRSVSHLVAGELANCAKGETWTKRFFDVIVYRPDDMLEILAYYLDKYGKDKDGKKRPVPNCVKKGFAAALARFDRYQLAKYRGEGAVVSLVDVVNLVHPKGNEVLSELVNGTLKAADTWETRLTAVGQKAVGEEDKAEQKKEAWTELIETRKIGYFALLRNLRNILEQAPQVLDKALELLTDERLITNSLV